MTTDDRDAIWKIQDRLYDPPEPALKCEACGDRMTHDELLGSWRKTQRYFCRDCMEALVSESRKARSPKSRSHETNH